MIREERLDRILAYVNVSKYATIKELSEHLRMSSSTIRRDVELLADLKKLSLTRGGIVAADNCADIVNEDPFQKKSEDNVEEKRWIAEEACKLIVPGSTVIIDAGSTTLQMIPYLRNLSSLNLVTNDVFIASALYDAPNITVNVLGGCLRKGFYSLVGYYTEQNVADMHADLCIIGTDAVSLSTGLMISNMDEVGLKRGIIAASNKVAVVCDHTKFSTKAFLTVCNLDEVDIIITGHAIDQQTLQGLRMLQKEVRLISRSGAIPFPEMEATD